MKRILLWIYWILQTIAFIMEFGYIITEWGLPGFGIGFFILPITCIALPFYMSFVSGIWAPLIITILSFIVIGISELFEDTEKRIAYGVNQSTNPFSVASLVLGIVSLFFDRFGILSLLAVIFGITGLVQIKKYNNKGKGIAITGLILGSVCLVLCIAQLINIYNDYYFTNNVDINKTEQVQQSIKDDTNNKQNYTSNKTEQKEEKNDTVQNSKQETVSTKKYCAGGQTKSCTGGKTCSDFVQCPGSTLCTNTTECPGATELYCTGGAPRKSL